MGNNMGICIKCGAPIIDDDSYQKAYCRVLSDSNKNRHILEGLAKLFSEKLIFDPISQEYKLAPFDLSEAIKLDIEKFINGQDTF